MMCTNRALTRFAAFSVLAFHGFMQLLDRTVKGTIRSCNLYVRDQDVVAYQNQYGFGIVMGTNCPVCLSKIVTPFQ